MLRLAAQAAKVLPKATHSPSPLVLTRSATRLVRRRRTPLPPHHSSPPPPTTVNAPTAPSEPSTLSPPALAEGSSPVGTTAVVPISPVSLIPVEVPHDPAGVVDRATGPWSEKLRELLSVPALVVAREIEIVNVLLGYEQANKYALLGPDGQKLAYLLEEEGGIGSAVKRQLMRTHRPFHATVISLEGEVLLRIHRPFALVNSRIYVSTPSSSCSTPAEEMEQMKRIEAGGPSTSSTALTTQQQQELSVVSEDAGEVIGEVQQEWHLYRRKYNLFVKRGEEFEQFAAYDGGLMAWDFECKDENGRIVGSVNRNFSGFARELFTDTGQYVLNFEASGVDLASLPPPTAEALPASTSSSSSSLASSPLNNALTTSTSDSPSTATASTALTTSTSTPLTLDQRCTLLASAVSIDIDYFSRSRGGVMGGGLPFMMPLPIPMGGMGGGAAEGAEAGAGEAGAIGTGNAHDPGPLPSTEPEESRGIRPEEEGAYPRGGENDGIPPGGGAGQGWGGDEEVMQDPWASESGSEEGGTWSWGDLFDNDDGGGGGGDSDW